MTSHQMQLLRYHLPSLLSLKQILIFKMSMPMKSCHQLLAMKMFARSMHVMEFFLTLLTECQFWVKRQKLKTYGQLRPYGLKKVLEHQSRLPNGWFLVILILICTHQISLASTITIKKKSTSSHVSPNPLIRHMESFIQMNSMNQIVKFAYRHIMIAKLP